MEKTEQQKTIESLTKEVSRLKDLIEEKGRDLEHAWAQERKYHESRARLDIRYEDLRQRHSELRLRYDEQQAVLKDANRLLSQSEAAKEVIELREKVEQLQEETETYRDAFERIADAVMETPVRLPTDDAS